MTSGQRDAENTLYALLGEQRGSLLGKTKIEIREMEKGRIGYKSIVVEAFVLNYSQPILFIDYNDGFYALYSYEDSEVNSRVYQPLKTLRFEYMQGAGHPGILLDLEGIKFFTDTHDENNNPITIYLDTGTFYNQAFRTEDDFYGAYAFKYHRDEFMKYMLDENSAHRSAFLSVVKTEYHHNVNR